MLSRVPTSSCQVRFGFCLLWILGMMQPVYADPASIPVPANQIGAGQPLWVDSNPDPEFALINARVDIGTLKRVGDAVEVQLQWPASPGLVQIFRENHPEVDVSETSQFIDRERVECRPAGMISYRVEATVLSGEGQRLYHQTYAPTEARAKAEANAQKFQTALSPLDSYGGDPRSLVCWAAARQCDQTDFTWPPPPNETPLDNSDEAVKMQAAYNRQFVSHCP